MQELSALYETMKLVLQSRDLIDEAVNDIINSQAPEGRTIQDISGETTTGKGTVKSLELNGGKNSLYKNIFQKENVILFWRWIYTFIFFLMSDWMAGGSRGYVYFREESQI